MKKNISRVIMTVLALLLSGCSAFNRQKQIVSIAVKPDGARVIVNGVEYHEAAQQFVVLCPSEEVLISVYKHGYKEKLHVVDYQLSSTGKLDALFAFWIVPAVGLLMPGAWELKENNIKLELEKLPEPNKEDIVSRSLILDGNRQAAGNAPMPTVRKPKPVVPANDTSKAAAPATVPTGEKPVIPTGGGNDKDTEPNNASAGTVMPISAAGDGAVPAQNIPGLSNEERELVVTRPGNK